MFSETRRLSSPSGALLAYHHLPATTGDRAILLVCHGLIEHSRRYALFAEAMAARGYHVYVHDHRGHGATTSAEAPLGRFAADGGADKVIEDVLAMREIAVAEHPGLPIVLFGHSMGGLISLNVAIARPQAFAGLAIWNANFNTGLSGRIARGVLALERILKGSDVPSAILPKATFDAWGRSIRGRRSEFDWLSQDAEIVARYAADPLCRFPASVSMWDDVLELAQRPMRGRMLDRLPRDIPIHLVGGRLDPATRGGKDVAWLARRLQNMDFSNVHLRIYDDMRHETLNEIGREAAIEEFARWLETVAPEPATV